MNRFWFGKRVASEREGHDGYNALDVDRIQVCGWLLLLLHRQNVSLSGSCRHNASERIGKDVWGICLNPEGNVMICVVGQVHWAWNQLIWLEGEAEIGRLDNK